MIVYTDKYKIPFEIDDDDWEIVSRYTWHIETGYPRTSIGVNGQYKLIRLHQLLLGKAPKGLMWDHIDRNRLNNKRNNLRLASARLNTRNSGIRKDNISGIKGVSWISAYKHWKADISIESKNNNSNRIVLGFYKTYEEAVEVRKRAEQLYWLDI